MQAKPRLNEECRELLDTVGRERAHQIASAVHRFYSMRSRQASCDAVSQLSFFAPYYTFKSVMAWFGVSRRQVFRARVHAMMFGPGVPVRVDAAQGTHAWRIPAHKLDTVVQLLTEGGFARTKPASRGASTQLLELQCSKADFLRAYHAQVGEAERVSDATVWRLLKQHQVTNLKHRECECSLCLTGSANLEALRELVDQLHARCTLVRSSAQQVPPAAGERVRQKLMAAAALRQTYSAVFAICLAPTAHSSGRNRGCMR